MVREMPLTATKCILILRISARLIVSPRTWVFHLRMMSWECAAKIGRRSGSAGTRVYSERKMRLKVCRACLKTNQTWVTKFLQPMLVRCPSSTKWKATCSKKSQPWKSSNRMIVKTHSKAWRRDFWCRPLHLRLLSAKSITLIRIWTSLWPVNCTKAREFHLAPRKWHPLHTFR